MLTIVGTGTKQIFSIDQANHNFLETSSTQRSHVGNPPHAIWDVSPRDGVTDVDYAVQIPNPPLLRNSSVIAGGDFVFDSARNYDHAYARTSVGIASDGNLYLVVADGENVHGGHGATANQLAHFLRDVLGATAAMGLDSALSTQMLLRTDAGVLHRVNTVTGEDATIDVNPYGQALEVDNPGLSWGSVGYYLKARL